MSSTTLLLGRSTHVRANAVPLVGWKQHVLGAAVVLHGLAHSNAIIWATGMGPSWLVTALWMGAVIGYLAAGFGILGTPVARTVWPAMLAAGTLASLVFLALAAVPLSSLGIALDLLLVPAAVAWGPDALTPRRRHPIAGSVALLALVWATLVVLWRPISVQWGTTPAERSAVLFGDDGMTLAKYRLDHAVTINAPVDSVWPWLAQLGQDRAGFYSYDWLERLFGVNVHNARTLNPAWQHLEQGDFVRATQATYLGGRLGDLGWRVTAIDPGRAFVLENWGAFVLRPVNDSTTRFQVRTRGDGEASWPSVLLGPVNIFVFEPAHFLMQRRMMLGVAERAERMMR
ncbi:MAG TPA: hypothetical protein VFZ73_10605 [Gemmatimonadaceae bacterium]